jgi:hypothetical protein
MKRSLMTLAAVGLLGLGLTCSATAMPVGNPAATTAAVDSDVIQVRHGHGGHMGRGGGRGHHGGWHRGRGHHYGWSRGRHRGWH